MSDKNMLLRKTETASGELAFSPDGKHLLIHGDATMPRSMYLSDSSNDFIRSSLIVEKKPSIVIADPPATPFEGKPSETLAFFEEFATFLDRNVADDTAVIMTYRERRGAGLLKSVLGSWVMMQRDWNLFREIVWRYGEAEFHRARPSFSLIHVFRRGNKPLQDSPYRYKDIVTATPPSSGDQDKFIMEQPIELVENLIRLFAVDGDRILDPFAGSAVVARAVENVTKADQISLLSTTLELDRGQFELLRDNVYPYLGISHG